MSTSAEQDTSRIEDEAALWLVTLAEAEEDATLRAEFERWRDLSPRHATIWERTERAYDLIGRSEPVHRPTWEADDGTVFDADARPTQGSGDRRGARLGRAGAWAAGLGALAAVLLLAVFLSGAPFRRAADYATATGETRAIPLEDGSTIHLAPRSAVDIAMAGGDGGTERGVTLVRGQAYFEVAPDATRPFVVRSGDTTVTVLGTAFDVERTDAATVVAVRHGRVRVADDSSAALQELTAGDWIVAGETTSAVGSGRAADAGSWMRGQLVAHSRPAGDVIGSLERYYDGLIVVADPSIASRQVTGLYDLEQPARTLRELAASHDAEVWQISPWMLLVTPR